MSGDVIFTERANGLTVVVIEGADDFAIQARYAGHEGVIAYRDDKRAAKALARSVAAVSALDGFGPWLASGGAAPMGRAF